MQTIGESMHNGTGLHSWIQARHLTESALLQYRLSFQSHPARLLVLKDFLQPSVADSLTRFLRDEAEFGLSYGLYSKHEAVSEEAWLQADDRERFFRFSRLKGVSPKHSVSRNTLTYLQFRRAFQDEEVRGFFERISALSLGWSDSFSCHSMKEGDFLRPHDDNGGNRRLALVFYLTPEWEARFGGALTVTLNQSQDTRIEAEYNTMVVFDVATGSKHFIEPVAAQAGNTARLTISGWYLNAEKGSHGDFAPLHQG